MRPLLLAFVLAPALAGAPVSGRVRDTVTGEPLARVKVAVQGGRAETVTSSDGSFTVEAQSGSTIIVSTVGYRPERVVISNEAPLEVALAPDVLRRNETIEVRDRADEPQPVASRTMSALEFQNTSSVLVNDPLRSVQTLPGVVSNDDFQAQFSFRGAEFRRIGLLMDGILLHSPFHTQQGDPPAASATLFSGDVLESITLHEGPLPAQYSDRTASIVAMTTRSGARDRVHGRGSASMSNFSGLVEGPVGKWGSWLVAARKSYLQYLIDRLSDDDTVAFGFSDLESRLDFDLGARQRLKLLVIHGTSGLNRERAIPRVGLNAVITSSYDFTLANLAHTWAITPAWLAEHRVAWIDEKWKNFNRDALGLGEEHYGEWVAGGDHSLRSGVFGLQGGYSFRRLRGNGEAFQQRTIPLPPLVIERYRGTGLRSGAYVIPSLRFWDGRLTLQAGTRWDRHDVNMRTATSPTASAAFSPWNRLRLSAAWGMSVQYPELLQYFGLGGSRDLLPERAQHFQAQGEVALGHLTSVRLSLWRRWDRDLLWPPAGQAYSFGGGIVPSLLTPLWRNQYRMAARGADVTLMRKSANGLSGWLSYAYTEAPVCCDVSGELFPSDYEQRHTFNAFGNYRARPSVNLSARFTYGSGTPVRGYYQGTYPDLFLSSRRNLLRLPEYIRLDVRANKTFQRDRVRWTLFAEAINVTNRENVRLDDSNIFNAQTGAARIRLEKTFPILPSVGLSVEF